MATGQTQRLVLAVMSSLAFVPLVLPFVWPRFVGAVAPSQKILTFTALRSSDLDR
jgi:hypothetical protein